jgi:hypothetical protein
MTKEDFLRALREDPRSLPDDFLALVAESFPKGVANLALECIRPVVEESFARITAREQTASDIAGRIREIGQLDLIEMDHVGWPHWFRRPKGPDGTSLLGVTPRAARRIYERALMIQRDQHPAP